MREVFVLIGLYGDDDFTCFGVFSHESVCVNELVRLQKCYDGTPWRFFYRSYIVNDSHLVDLYINYSDFDF